MLKAIIRLARAQSPTLFSSPLPYQIGRRNPGFKLQLAAAASNQSRNSDDMEHQQQQTDQKTGDVMSHSFGEGYATRSDEEGFGGTCGPSDSARKIDLDRDIHENHPAYDKSQGSKVAEKEQGRHQKQTGC